MVVLVVVVVVVVIVVDPVLIPRSVLRLALLAEALMHMGGVDQKSHARVAGLADVGGLGQLES